MSGPLPLTPRECCLVLLSAAASLMLASSVRDDSPPQLQAPQAAPAGPTFSQAGRVVIVTGASKGIGKGIAMVFAEAGASVLVTSRHMDEANAAAADIVAAGFVASAFEGDVGVEASVVDMVATAVARYGAVDVICANAGIIPDESIENLAAEAWDSAFSTNVKGTFLVVKHAMPYLKQSAYGRVVLTSSITGPITGFPGWSHYGATKAAQLGFMRSAAMELAPAGVTINAVMPGNILTEGLVALGDEYLRGVEAVIPLGYIGAVRDIGYAALYFASKQAGFVTGTTLVVDGGQTVPETAGFREAWAAKGLA